MRGIELVNPGSVGMPFDGDTRAAYALLHDDGRIEHRRVAYDHAASAARVRARSRASGPRSCRADRTRPDGRLSLLEAHGLAVRRGGRTVLSGVGFALAAGATVRLAGPNGSGKTSLLRVLAGVAEPSAGALRRPAAWAFVPEKVVLAPALRGREWLDAMRAMRGLGPADWPAAATAGGLEPAVLGAPSATLSKGMLQRLALLEAVHARCPLLLLDEPFAGLDEPGRDWLAAGWRRARPPGPPCC